MPTTSTPPVTAVRIFTKASGPSWPNAGLYGADSEPTPGVTVMSAVGPGGTAVKTGSGHRAVAPPGAGPWLRRAPGRGSAGPAGAPRLRWACWRAAAPLGAGP